MPANKPDQGQNQAAQPETVALFVSDIHLQADMPRTAQAFFDFLHRFASHTQQLYLLGDIFEYWAGDDDMTAFNQQVIDAIRQVSDSGISVFWISGNRDFLVGAEFAQACGLTILPDPHVINIAGRRIVITHGDALCTDDLGYMAFRAQVRQTAWQQEFLKHPLEQRKAIIAGVRQSSKDAQRDKADYIMDANANAVQALHDDSQTAIMIHGHTHRPARHVHINDGKENIRYVLPDWDADGNLLRGGWIAITTSGQITRLNLDGSILAETA